MAKKPATPKKSRKVATNWINVNGKLPEKGKEIKMILIHNGKEIKATGFLARIDENDRPVFKLKPPVVGMTWVCPGTPENFQTQDLFISHWKEIS